MKQHTCWADPNLTRAAAIRAAHDLERYWPIPKQSVEVEAALARALLAERLERAGRRQT